MPTDEGHCNNPQRKEADINEKEGGQGDSRLNPGVEVTAGSGSSREDKRAYLPITSIPHNDEPNGMWMLSPQLLCLIVLLHNADASVVPDHTQKESS